MPLPKFQAISQFVSSKDWSLLQTSWSALLDPLLKRAQNQSNIIDASLKVGSNTIDHRLGKKLQGWKIVMQDALSSIYDSQATNSSPDKTLILISSAATNVSIEVF